MENERQIPTAMKYRFQMANFTVPRSIDHHSSDILPSVLYLCIVVLLHFAAHFLFE